MGLMYQYAGGVGYSRFNNEIEQIAKIFGGKENKESLEKRDTENKQLIECQSGYIGSTTNNVEIYVFPENTNPILVKWFNNLHDIHSPSDTLIVYNEFCKHEQEISKISNQIMHELKTCVECKDCWYVR